MLLTDNVFLTKVLQSIPNQCLKYKKLVVGCLKVEINQLILSIQMLYKLIMILPHDINLTIIYELFYISLCSVILARGCTFSTPWESDSLEVVALAFQRSLVTQGSLATCPCKVNL